MKRRSLCSSASHRENGLLPYELYVDDGYSGLSFQRPDFQRMIDDVAVGKVGVVVVKDLSRFGRDHIVVGQYQEIYFRPNGCVLSP